MRFASRRVTLGTIFMLLSLMMALYVAAQQRQARPEALSPPTPRRADDTVNLGSTEPNKGFWTGRQHWGYEEITTRPQSTTPVLTRDRGQLHSISSGPHNGEIMEYICQENNLWLERLQKQGQ
jgi:hypothetical protein